MKKWKIGMISALALLVMVLGGCQAIGGVDLNKVLTDNMSVTSYEGSSNIEVELIVNDDVELTESEASLVEWFSEFSLQFDEIKVQDLTTMSMKGTLHMQEGSLDFILTLDTDETVIWLEGAEKPIVLPSTYDDPSMPTEMIEIQRLLSGEAFTEDILETVQLLGGFLIEHFPNPGRVSVDDAAVTINGEELELKQVHIELNGGELLGLVKTFLENLAEDEEGLKQTLGDIYDVLIPTIKEIVALSAADAEDASMDPFLMYMENKELAVELLYTMVKGQVDTWLEDFDTYADEWRNQPEGETFFQERNALVMDLYVDGDGVVHKQDLELTVYSVTDNHGIAGFRVYNTNEIWNHHGDVTADLLDTTDALVVGPDMEPEALRANFEDGSLVQEWIDQLEQWQEQFASVQVVVLDMSQDEPAPGYANQPYIVQGVTMVPIDYVSEQLGVLVDWDPATNQVTITDFVTEIELTVGDSTAVVDGVETALNMPGELREDEVYVPIRFIAESLGGDVMWDNETKTMIIVW